MKIILLEKINKKNNIGDIIEVKNGYAKNFLIPTKKCIIATKKNIFFSKTQLLNNLNQKESIKIKNLEKINNTFVFIPLKTKNNNEIYGTYNEKRLLKIIKKLNIKIDIKTLITNFSTQNIGSYKLTFNNKKLDKKTDIFINLLKI